MRLAVAEGSGSKSTVSEKIPVMYTLSDESTATERLWSLLESPKFLAHR